MSNMKHSVRNKLYQINNRKCSQLIKKDTNIYRYIYI